MAQIDVHIRVADNALREGTSILDSENLKGPAVVICEKTEETTPSVLKTSLESKSFDTELQDLFSENIYAKAWRVAKRDLENNVRCVSSSFVRHTNSQTESTKSISRVRTSDWRRLWPLHTSGSRLLDLWLLSRNFVLSSREIIAISACHPFCQRDSNRRTTRLGAQSGESVVSVSNLGRAPTFHDWEDRHS